jgi:hypothetical protein
MLIDANPEVEAFVLERKREYTMAKRERRKDKNEPRQRMKNTSQYFTGNGPTILSNMVILL